MTTIAAVCRSIHEYVKKIGEAAWELDSNCGLLEETRRLHQYLRLVEALIAELNPYLEGVRAWGSLREVEAVLSTLLQLLLEVGGKGLLVRYLQSDRVLAHFAAATARLGAALAHLEAAAGDRVNVIVDCFGQRSASAGSCLGSLVSHPVPRLSEELGAVRGLLQSAEFSLTPEHLNNLRHFRKACDGLQVHFQSMMLAYMDMIEHMKLDRWLDKRSFCAIIEELKSEVELQQQVLLQGVVHLPLCCQMPNRGDCSPPGGAEQTISRGYTQRELEQARHCAAAEQHYLRMLMDLLRASHIDTDREAPLEFLCPLTHQLLQDPVLLHDTGHSYERKALEEWWTSGHHFCPRTGLHLRRLNISPNHNLRTAIERWSLHSDMHLTFKPVLATLVAQRQCQQVQALTSTPCHDALQNAAASLEPGLQEPVQSRGVRPG